MTATDASATDPGARSARRNLGAHFDAGVVGRAVLAALVLGTLLTLANQPDAVFGAQRLAYLPLALVYLTPFLVVAISQLLGAAQAAAEWRDGTAPALGQESLMRIGVGHGIPRRAALLGLLMGGANTTIAAAELLAWNQSLGLLPLPLLAQAFSLPILFSLLSQAVSYRRAAVALDRSSRRNE